MDKIKHKYNPAKSCVFSPVEGLNGLWNRCKTAIDRDSELKRVLQNEPDQWCGGSWADLEQIITAGGWVDPVPRARDLAAKMAAASASAGVRPCWRADVVGAVPCVPAYVSNAPDAMLRRDNRACINARAPINLWIGLGASSSVDSDDITRRGAVVLAAYLALSRVRRVNVRLYNTNDRGNVIIDLPQSFAISELCALLCSPNVMRRLMTSCCAYAVQFFTNSRTMRGYGGVSWAFWSHDENETRRVLSSYGLRDGDLVIGPGKIGAWDKMSDNEIVGEINQFIRSVK